MQSNETSRVPMNTETDTPTVQEARGARLTVLNTVHYQVVGEQPTTVLDGRFSTLLDTTEEQYVRRLVVGPEWKPIDKGWVERVKMLIICNEEGKRLQRIPTEEESCKIAGRIVEICFVSPVSEDNSAWPSWEIPPGEFFSGNPVDIRCLRIRCRSEQAKCVIGIIPG